VISRRLLVAVGGVGLLLVGLSALLHAQVPGADAAPKAQPNIVVILLDDTAVHDGRLWSDPALTPTLHENFVANGVHFPNAIAETPLCCPNRATLLTGLHTHNHGVKVNDVALFNPTVSLATELQASGYETMWIGKYMNHPEHLTPELWEQHAAGWSAFDIFVNPYTSAAGFFVDYTIRTKEGDLLMPEQHSTEFIGQQTVARMENADPDKPIFAVLSPVDTHLPNIPMPQFEADARCNSMQPWKPLNYNEADVSDKPAYVRSLPLVPYPEGWPMTTMCREMLGVDWMVEQVTDELARQGRLDDTLLVFTADNGMAWGAHRLELKETPYVTPVPLYFSWPSRWAPQEVEEHVSSIDLAPTLCEIGGCEMGPYQTGQRQADGVSIVPLLDGEEADLGRDALLETEYRIRPWAAVRTTALSNLGLWHYVEYQSGFRELYDLEQDPHELTNIVDDPAHADIRAALHDRLLELLAEGRPVGPATLTITLDAVPNTQDDFTFTGDLGSFTLDDDSTVALPRKRVFSGLAPGPYTVTQLPTAGWTLTALTCPPGADVDLGNGTVTVNLVSSDQVTCTFKNAGRRPDARIAVGIGAFKGDNVYATTAQKRQTQRWDGAPAGQTLDFAVGLQNDSQIVDSFTVKSVETGHAGIAVAYLVNNVDVTAQVLAGTYSVPNLSPSASVMMVVRVTVALDTPPAVKKKVVLTQRSTSVTSRIDVVRAVIAR